MRCSLDTAVGVLVSGPPNPSRDRASDTKHHNTLLHDSAADVMLQLSRLIRWYLG